MTSSTSIRIISERSYSISPAPGRSEKRVAVTYQLPGRPPSVIFLTEDLQRTDAELRRIILAREAEKGLPNAREI